MIQVQARFPVDVAWLRPWDPEESNPQRRWRWSQGPTAEVVLENPRPEPVTIRVDFKAAVPLPRPVVVQITGLAERGLSFTGEPPALARLRPGGTPGLTARTRDAE